MKKLGLIGGTGPESTIIYYSKITSQVQQKTGNFPPMTIESLSVFDVLRYMDANDYDGLSEYLLNGIKNLALAGADFAALTGITPHIVMDRLQANSPIPVISMLDTTRDCLSQEQLKNVILMGTRQTLTSGFFQRYLTQNHIHVILPNKADIEYMGTKIETELELGKVVPETQKKFEDITRRLITANQADALILGCTELPLIFNKIPLPIKKVDVMNEHIKKLAGLIVK